MNDQPILNHFYHLHQTGVLQMRVTISIGGLIGSGEFMTEANLIEEIGAATVRGTTNPELAQALSRASRDAVTLAIAEADQEAEEEPGHAMLLLRDVTLAVGTRLIALPFWVVRMDRIDSWTIGAPLY